METLQFATLHDGAVVGDSMPIDPAEHQGSVAEIEVGEPFDECLVEGISFESGLKRAAEVRFGEVTQPPRRAATLTEAVVGVIDVGLFVGEFRVVLGHRFRVFLE